MNKEYNDQFKKDHQGELWEELEEAVQKVKPTRHTISGEDFPELEPEEQVALLKVTASVLGTQKPMNMVLLHSYEALVTSLSLPEPIKEHLLHLPQKPLTPFLNHLAS